LKNNLKDLSILGQSIWLDYIQRDLIYSSELRQLIEYDGIRGMTSNPAIFEKAIAGSQDYDKDIRTMTLKEMDCKEIYESLSQSDVQGAADQFRAIYDITGGRDGYVSLEVNPHLAYDTKGTIDEARLIWTSLNRPNVFIKIPATTEGLQAIQQLISEGININVTLLFGLPRYRQVAEAYISGIEERVAQGKSVKQLSSVASFFISRIDEKVDPLLKKIFTIDDNEIKLYGQVAIASAKVAYQIYKEIFSSDRFKKLAEHGALSQRLLWASTGTKNKDYSDVKYIEALIGVDTVNTVPIETIEAYRKHGEPKVRLQQDTDKAYQVLQQLTKFGINIDKITQQLEKEGVEKFIQPFDRLMEILASKCHGYMS
jgi:transaldolase